MEHLSVEVLAEATITVLVEATMTVLLEATTTVLGQLPRGKSPPPPQTPKLTIRITRQK